MPFQTKTTLSEDEIRLSLARVLKDGITTQVMLTLTSGVILISFALDLGSDNIIVGLLVAIPFLSQLIQLPAIYLIEKIRIRRKVTVVAAILSRFFLLPLAIIPFFIHSGSIFLLLLGIIALHFSVGAVGSCSWDSWMRDLIPERQLGRFFSRRLAYAMFAGIIAAILAGLFIDYWKANFIELEIYSYSFLFLTGFIVGMIGVGIVSMIFEPEMESINQVNGFNFREILEQPFGDANFRKLLIFLGTWNFGISLAAPFFTVYMLTLLDMDLIAVIILQIISQLVNILFFNLWGNLTDKYSNKSVLLVSCPLFLLSILLWIFTTIPGPWFLTYPLLLVIHLFIGISMAGINLASGNIGLKLAPKGKATSYLAMRNLIIALAAGVAPLLGGIVAELFSESHGYFSSVLQNFDFLFILAFIFGLYSLYRLSKVQEIGQVEERVIIQELFIGMKKYVSILPITVGIRQMTHIPAGLLVSLKQLRKRKKQSKNQEIEE
ncbi:MAG: MFS transporter [Candidatus Odinarchaeota archaeon]